jgi:hypothetical protein
LYGVPGNPLPSPWRSEGGGVALPAVVAGAGARIVRRGRCRRTFDLRLGVANSGLVGLLASCGRWSTVGAGAGSAVAGGVGRCFRAFCAHPTRQKPTVSSKTFRFKILMIPTVL